MMKLNSQKWKFKCPSNMLLQSTEEFLYYMIDINGNERFNLLIDSVK